MEVIRGSSLLDPANTEQIDISPGARGNNPLGTNDGAGHDLNPATGQPYESDIVNEGDFVRVMVEFWADGPKSETPPGHWNVLANKVGDELGTNLQIGGSGPQVDRLEWDVKTYLALNGAVHDAAIAAWGLKGHYDSVRPISMIRYMGSLGQSSDPAGPAFNPDGLPLVPGPHRGHHRRDDRRRADATRPSPATRTRSPSAHGPASQPTRRPRPAGPSGSWPSNGSPTSCRRS